MKKLLILLLLLFVVGCTTYAEEAIENDIEEKFVRSSGPGGQKVNKTSTCVHLSHIPTGLTVKVQKSRTQPLNRYYARKQMCELLENKLLGKESPQAKKIEKIKKQKDRRSRRTP